MAKLAYFWNAMHLLAAILDAADGVQSHCSKVLGRHCPLFTIWCSSHGIGPEAPSFAAYGGLATVNTLIIEESPGMTALGATALIGLTSLASVNITLTGLTEIDPEAFAPAAATLEDLTLSRNKLKFVRSATLARLRGLKYLDLSGNQLGSAALNSLMSRGLPQLTHLDLSQNALRSLPPAAFSRSPRLQTICLDNNPLKKLDGRIFENLAYLSALTVRSRSLNCTGAGSKDRLRLQSGAGRSFAGCVASNGSSSHCLCAFRGCFEPPSYDQWTRGTCNDARSRGAAAAGALEAALSRRARARLASTELELMAAADPVTIDSGVAACELRRGTSAAPRGVSLRCQYKTNGTVVFYCGSAAVRQSDTSSIENEAIRLFMAGSYKYRAIASDSNGASALYVMGDEHSCVIGIFADITTAPQTVQLPRFTRCY